MTLCTDNNSLLEVSDARMLVDLHPPSRPGNWELLVANVLGRDSASGSQFGFLLIDNGKGGIPWHGCVHSDC